MKKRAYCKYEQKYDGPEDSVRNTIIREVVSSDDSISVAIHGGHTYVSLPGISVVVPNTHIKILEVGLING